MLIRVILNKARKRGFNLRHILIVGSGDLGQAVAKKINLHPEFGMKIIGFLTSHPEKVGSEVNGIQVVGLYQDISKINQNISKSHHFSSCLQRPNDQHMKNIFSVAKKLRNNFKADGLTTALTTSKDQQIESQKNR